MNYKKTIVIFIIGLIIIATGLFFLKFVTKEKNTTNPVYKALNEDKFSKYNINISEIKEEPIKNQDGLITNIKFTVFIEPSTPIPDATFDWNGARLESILPHQHFWESDRSLHSQTLIDIGEEIYGLNGGKINVKNNSFETLLGKNIIGEIIKNKINGPYLFLMYAQLFDHSHPGKVSVTYNLNLKDKELYNELCEVSKAIMKANKTEDRCGVKNKNGEYQTINIPYKTNAYSYTEFSSN